MARIIQITDTHVVVPPIKVSKRIESADLLKQAVANIKENLPKLGQVDAIIATGDISDNGTTDSYALFRELIAPLELPFYVIPGNHDRRESMREVFADQSYIPASGPLNWSVTIKGLNLIGLDTLVEGQGAGALTAQTLDYLESELSNCGDTPTWVAMHHPLFSSGIRFMDAIGLSGVGALVDVINASTADVRIICGHVHSVMIGAVGRASAIASPATCSTFAADFRRDAPVGFMSAPGGFMVHDWDGTFRSIHVGAVQGTGPRPF